MSDLAPKPTHGSRLRAAYQVTGTYAYILFNEKYYIHCCVTKHKFPLSVIIIACRVSQVPTVRWRQEEHIRIVKLYRVNNLKRLLR